MTVEWKRFINNYKERGLVLFLGAGVSKDSGVPSWLELIRDMMTALDETGGVDTFLTLHKKGYSLPAITEFIQQTVDKQRFIATLRNCLYQKFPFKGRKMDEDIGAARGFLDHTEKSNPTLAAVAKLLASDELAANPNIHSVVNFNLDSLVESYDKAQHKVKEVKGRYTHKAKEVKGRYTHTIESSAHTRIAGRISIYHPTDLFGSIENLDWKLNQPFCLNMNTLSSKTNPRPCLIILCDICSENITA